MLISALYVVIGALLTAPTDTAARRPTGAERSKQDSPIQRSLVLDGSPVHDAGMLHLHTGNWGAFGSMPGTGAPYSHAPSAEWPAGSGIEYLYVAGLWVGALKGGVPAVSTASFAREFLPTENPTDVIYYATEGDFGGARLPTANADDDGDGAIDEEWLDGRDNDGDSQIDEDFAAISDQMQSCWYTDDQPGINQHYPQHNPLHILVRQRSFQWSDPRFDDFVGFDYTFTNIGSHELTDVYLGLFVDGDVGSRNTPNYWEDDLCGYNYVPNFCTEWGGVDVEYAYTYDADGDQGQATGHCGVLLLDHTTDPAGVTAPSEVAFSSFQVLSNQYPPTNNYEQYEVMSAQRIDSPSPVPRDYRFLVTVGPFSSLPPGETLELQVALFAGDGTFGGGTEVIQHAAAAKLAYLGRWFDLDADPSTGVDGRETPVYGPAYDVVVDSCRVPPVVVPYVPPGQVVWTNADCAREETIRTGCGYTDADSALFRTGIDGKEEQVHWVLPSTSVFVTSFDVHTTSTAAHLTWELSTGESVLGFRIHRNALGGPLAVLPSQLGMFPPGSRSFTDPGVTSSGRPFIYRVIAILEDGSEARSGTVQTTVPPWSTALYQNYPNPFNPATTISFTLSKESPVNLSVFTVEGKRIAKLINEVLPAGFNDVAWDGKDANGNVLSTGVYFYRLKAGKTVLSKKMIYLK